MEFALCSMNEMNSPYSVQESASLNTLQKLKLAFDWVRKNDHVPDLSEDVTFICRIKSFDTAIRNALERNSKVKPHQIVSQFVPRPWQKKVFTNLENQTVIFLATFKYPCHAMGIATSTNDAAVASSLIAPSPNLIGRRCRAHFLVPFGSG